jgi:dihydrofolate reductase
MSGSILSIIAAVADNGVIGTGGGMPWRLSTDMKRFKALTIGKPVIMGRKTFETIGKALVGRTNIVISRRQGYAPGGVDVASSLSQAIAVAKQRIEADPEVFVIGGGEIYSAAIGLADRLYITHVHAAPEGDTHFPRIDPGIWRQVSTQAFPAGERDSVPTTFAIYERGSGHAFG